MTTGSPISTAAGASGGERRAAPPAAEPRLRRIIEAMADAVVVVDGDGVVKFVNPAAASLFGRPAEEVVGDHFGLPVVAAGETTEVDLVGGRVAEMRMVDLAWDGEPAVVASLRDVTARKEAELAARRLWRERTARDEAEKERERLQELLARAPGAILTTRGPEHRCAFANPVLCDLVRSGELLGRPLAEALPELAGQGFLEGFDRAFLSGEGGSHGELGLTFARGGERVVRWVDVTWQPLSRDGELDGVLCFAYDVSAQVTTRRELERAMERLREEERRKDQFLAVLGHELRNPLAGISAGLGLLDQPVDGERREWTLRMMRRQVSTVTRLLDDLLDVSAIARGKLELERQVLPLAEVVDAVLAAVGARFEEAGQELSLSVPDERLHVDGDARRLGQVVSNLLVNASKYSPRGAGVELRLRRDGGEAVVEVADDGQGIEPELLDHIFEPFIQGNRGSPLAGGLGIGLTLVRQLVEMHGGAVAAASPGPGQGSTFTLRLPLAAAPAEPVALPAVEQPAAPAAGRVLVVDDNEDAARALAELLTLHGCATDTAATGREALAKTRRERPDAVLLDLDLPDLSGYEVASRLRTGGGLDGLLIVAVSGFGHEQARQRSAESGIDHHLVKPVDLPRLLALLGGHLQGGGEAGAARQA